MLGTSWFQRIAPHLRTPTDPWNKWVFFSALKIWFISYNPLKCLDLWENPGAYPTARWNTSIAIPFRNNHLTQLDWLVGELAVQAYLLWMEEILFTTWDARNLVDSEICFVWFMYRPYVENLGTLSWRSKTGNFKGVSWFPSMGEGICKLLKDKDELKVFYSIISFGQIIETLHDLTPKCSWRMEFPLISGKSRLVFPIKSACLRLMNSI